MSQVWFLIILLSKQETAKENTKVALYGEAFDIDNNDDPFPFIISITISSVKLQISFSSLCGKGI